MKIDVDWENDRNRIEHPRILVIDDEPLILRNLEVLLSNKGCEVTVASSGAAGIKKALENPPDAVLLDVVMPDMDGYDVCRRLKNEPTLKHVPVLLITALNDVFSKVKGLDAGADDFISKPFNETELRARVWAHLRTKRLHDQLEANYRRVKELEQLKESLTHMIMHDVSSPLTAAHFGLDTVIEAIDSGKPLSAAHDRLLRTAASACRRVVDMLRDVMVVKRLEENKFPIQISLVDLRAAISDCLSLLEPNSLAAGVSIRTDIPLDIPKIEGDEGLLTRIVMNLVSNSLKFTPRGGQVTVILRCLSEIEIEGVVSDTGVGIPEDQLARVFEKYVQVEEGQARTGLGLGLAFCHQAIAAHHGRIWAEKNTPVGSRFCFRLPVKSPLSLSAHPSPLL